MNVSDRGGAQTSVSFVFGLCVCVCFTAGVVVSAGLPNFPSTSCDKVMSQQSVRGMIPPVNMLIFAICRLQLRRLPGSGSGKHACIWQECQFACRGLLMGPC